MSDKTRGLYRKYRVERLNDPTGKHTNCPFFVLDIIHDQHARNALCAYANSCRVEFPQLAADLHTLLTTDALIECEDTLAERTALDVAMAENDGWRELCAQMQQRNHEAFMLLGQVLYFLQTYHDQPIGAQNQQAAKLRTAIKQLAGLK